MNTTDPEIAPMARMAADYAPETGAQSGSIFVPAEASPAPRADPSRKNFSRGEWEEVTRQVMSRMYASMLDTPDSHLAYVRRQLTAAD